MLSEKYANICQKERPWDLKRVYLFGRYLHNNNNTGSLVQVAVQSHTLFHNSSKWYFFLWLFLQNMEATIKAHIKCLGRISESLRKILKQKLHIKSTFNKKGKLQKRLLKSAQMVLLLWASKHEPLWLGFREISLYGYHSHCPTAAQPLRQVSLFHSSMGLYEHLMFNATAYSTSRYLNGFHCVENHFRVWGKDEDIASKKRLTSPSVTLYLVVF